MRTVTSAHPEPTRIHPEMNECSMTDNIDQPPTREGDNTAPDLLDLAYSYALDAVPASEEAAIDAHLLVTDDETRSAFHDLTREVGETMALVSASTSVTPPAELRARILNAIDDIPQDPPMEPTMPGHGRQRRLKWFVLAAAAITVLAAGGYAVSQLPSDNESQRLHVVHLG